VTEHEQWVTKALDGIGAGAELIGSRVGGVAGAAVGMTIKLLTSAIANAMRNQGRSVDDILAAIAMPKPLDTSFQADIDAAIAAKPKK